MVFLVVFVVDDDMDLIQQEVVVVVSHYFFQCLLVRLRNVLLASLLKLCLKANSLRLLPSPAALLNANFLRILPSSSAALLNVNTLLLHLSALVVVAFALTTLGFDDRATALFFF